MIVLIKITVSKRENGLSKIEIETHFETRQEYVIVGNELASLEEKHKRDKEEAERKKKELEELMASMISNVNNVSAKGGSAPMHVPPKHNTKKAEVSDSKLIPSEFNAKNSLPKKLDSLNKVKPLDEKKELGKKSIGSDITRTIINTNSLKNNI